MYSDKNELSERKKMILRAIIDAHIKHGEPVGSKYLSQDKQITFSSATIRNEMAELEDMGYLEQPHTSAGRIPSELGYRFYVDSLIQRYRMTQQEIAQIRSELRKKEAQLDSILSNAARLASTLSNYTALSIKPRMIDITIDRFETVYMNENNFILVMIMDNGVIKTKYIHLASPIARETVELLTAVLNEHIAGIPADRITLPLMIEIESAMEGNSALVNPIIKSIYETMKEMDGGELRFEGINRMLLYPEYSDMDKMREMLAAFEQKDEILNTLISSDDGGDMKIYIGSENQVKVMKTSTLIYKKVKSGGKTVGAIGILGPCRMDYARMIALMDGLGAGINGLLGSGENDDNKDE